MKRIALACILVSAGALGSGAIVACGGSTPPPKEAKVVAGGSKDPNKWPADDRTMCDWRNKPELEVSETAGPGAIKPNVRRVFKTFGEAENRHKTLICREIDTNLDGIKDVARMFNDKGEATKEEADTDYDGKLDIWMQFVAGRMSEEDEDTNNDGKADVWKYYVQGVLSRIKRDRNFDGQADVWEIYTRGHLERMGIDDSFDGHVDRWDRDEQLRAEADEQDRKAREAADSPADAGADAADAAPAKR